MKEFLTILVFAGLYIFARVVEVCIVPLIPEFFTREISALFRWGPILIPIIFGLTYYKKNDSSDDILKERMMAWSKK
jgi:hypothetical protein